MTAAMRSLSMTCRGPGCSQTIEQQLTGRPREFCCDTCRRRAFKYRERQLVAIEVADLILQTPERALRLALAELPGDALATLRAGLSGRI